MWERYFTPTEGKHEVAGFRDETQARFATSDCMDQCSGCITSLIKFGVDKTEVGRQKLEEAKGETVLVFQLCYN